MKVYFDFFGMNKGDVYCNIDGSLYDNPDGECIIGPEYRNQTQENYQFFNPGDYLVYDDKNVLIDKSLTKFGYNIYDYDILYTKNKKRK